MTQKKDKATAEQADTAKQTDTAERAGTAKQTDTFVVELGLSVEDQVNWQLCKVLDLQRHCYNGVMSFAHKSLKSMRSNKGWQAAYQLPKTPERLQKLNEFCKKYHLTEFDFIKQATRVCKAMHRDDMGAHEAQCIGRYVWRAVEPYRFKQSGMPRFKSASRGINTISGTDNNDIKFDIVQLVHNAPKTKKKRMPKEEVRNGRSFLVTDDNYKPTKIKPTCHCLPKKPKADRPLVYWRGAFIPIRYKETPYYRAAFSKDSNPDNPLTVDNLKRVKFCRIVRRSLKGKKRWFVQISLEGKPPVLHPRAPITDCMGIDPGPQKIAYFAEKASGKMFSGNLAVAPHVEEKAAEKRRLQRKMARSMRFMNPDKYNANGTVKKGARNWRKSNHYLKCQAKYRELCRKEAATRYCDHGTVINRILAIAGTIKIEENNYRAFQRSWFGRSIQHSGMGSFFAHLKRKAASAGLEVIDLDPVFLKLSQYDPERDEYVKKPLKQRWHEWGNTGIKVDRDRMSAFLACYADNQTGHDRTLLLSKWSAAEALLRVSDQCSQKQPCTINTSRKVLKRIRKRRKMQLQRCEDSRAQGQAKSKTKGTGKRSDVNS